MLADALTIAGFVEVEVRAVPSPVVLPSAADCVRFQRESFGALHQMMAALTPVQREETWHEVETALARFEDARDFVGPCEMLVGAGRRPAWRRRVASQACSRR